MIARVLALVVLAVSLLWPIEHALAQEGELTTKAKNAILIDYETGSILFQKAPDELVPPASLSKLMTLAVLFRALKDGKVKLEDELQTSENAWRTGGAPSGTSAMFIPIHNKTPISELIQGIIVQSGNDACITVAEGLGGNVPKFAEMMEAEARRLGMKKSTFRNPTGLDDPAQLMTARELALLAQHLVRDYPEQYKVFAQKEFAYRRHKFYNRNPLLGPEFGVDGLKTGHTSTAGYGLVFSMVHEGRRLIGVVMGLADERERKDEARRMIEWGKKSYAQVKLFDAHELVGSARVWGGQTWYVPLTGDGQVDVILPRFPAGQKLRGEIVYQGPLKPPIKKGDQVAVLRVTSTVGANPEPTAVTEAPLYAAEDVEPSGFVWKGVDSLLHLALRMVRL